MSLTEVDPSHVVDADVERSASPDGASRRGRWIDEWEPEDEQFWAATGAKVARRNLICSVVAEHVGFCVWSMWSVIVLFLGPKYGLDPGRKFLLTTMPSAVGATLRIPYTFAVAKLGGRNWTIIAALLLIIPTVWCAVILVPGVSFPQLLLAASLAGIGGGNFSSSMANIDSFYPLRMKGWALGLNAGGGNLGVPVVQLIGLLVLATAGKDHPRVMIAILLPLVVFSAALAWRYMDNLSGARNDRGAMREAARLPQTWTLAALYIGTFGSFIGFAFAFGQVLQVQFGSTFDTPVKAAYLTFLGPLLGSLARPYGGRLADRLGGARVTFWNFVAMTIGAACIVGASLAKSLPLFLVAFVSLFVLTGIGNGSIYKMIPVVFRSAADADARRGVEADEAVRTARRRTRAVIGFIGAIGTFGGVFVNLGLRQSFLSTGSGTTAYVGFIVAYVACAVLTWAVYVRPARQAVTS